MDAGLNCSCIGASHARCKRAVQIVPIFQKYFFHNFSTPLLISGRLLAATGGRYFSTTARLFWLWISAGPRQKNEDAARPTKFPARAPRLNLRRCNVFFVLIIKVCSGRHLILQQSRLSRLYIRIADTTCTTFRTPAERPSAFTRARNTPPPQGTRVFRLASR